MDNLNAPKLCELTGATYRQIDYWVHLGLILPVGDANPGSGRHRKFDPNIVERVKLMVRFSKAFHGFINHQMLQTIYTNYDQGYADIGEGLILSWKTTLKEKQHCKFCPNTESYVWYKCCSDHCTERGPDVVCQDCFNKCHGVSLADSSK